MYLDSTMVGRHFIRTKSCGGDGSFQNEKNERPYFFMTLKRVYKNGKLSFYYWNGINSLEGMKRLTGKKITKENIIDLTSEWNDGNWIEWEDPNKLTSEEIEEIKVSMIMNADYLEI